MANIKQIVLKDAEGNVLGTYDIKDANVPHSSESAVSGGTTLSLVTTGEKYKWNNKPDTISGQTDTTISSPQNYDRLTYENGKWVNENEVYIRNGKHFSIANANGQTVLDAYNSGGGYVAVNSNNATTISLAGGDGTVTCSDVSCPKVFKRDTFVASTAAYSADDMRGSTRFLYSTHGVPYTGTTVAFDSSNNTNYSFQLNAKYSAAAGEARYSFRTRYGDGSRWSNWLECCPVYKYPNRLESNSTETLYVPYELRSSTKADVYLLVCANNYGNSGVYLLCPSTVTAHQILITNIKAASYLTVSSVSDDYGFKLTATSAAFQRILVRIS